MQRIAAPPELEMPPPRAREAGQRLISHHGAMMPAIYRAGLGGWLDRRALDVFERGVLTRGRVTDVRVHGEISRSIQHHEMFWIDVEIAQPSGGTTRGTFITPQFVSFGELAGAGTAGLTVGDEIPVIVMPDDPRVWAAWSPRLGLVRGGGDASEWTRTPEGRKKIAITQVVTVIGIAVVSACLIGSLVLYLSSR